MKFHVLTRGKVLIERAKNYYKIPIVHGPTDNVPDRDLVRIASRGSQYVCVKAGTQVQVGRLSLREVKRFTQIRQLTHVVNAKLCLRAKPLPSS